MSTISMQNACYCRLQPESIEFNTKADTMLIEMDTDLMKLLYVPRQFVRINLKDDN